MEDQRDRHAGTSAEPTALHTLQLFRDRIGQVIVGASTTIELALIALLAEGHLLIEDVPGTGKTTLAKTLAAGLGSTFSRIQCTPDLLPSDVTGMSYFNQRSQEFEFRPGPIFGQIVLADEINRATPRTQSAFLEAMAEGQVTAEGVRRSLPSPFLVVATQNPIELEGTFPLPEAQLDRFLLRASMGYPSRDEELEIVARFSGEPVASSTTPLIDEEQVRRLQRACRRIHVSATVAAYAVDIVRATRERGAFSLGASPRAAVNLVRASRARALLLGREFVLPDDVKALVAPVLAHRVMLAEETQLHDQRAVTVIGEIVAEQPAPVEPEAVAARP